MPHQPRPFYRAPRNTWFVEVDKKQVPLGKHPATAPAPRKGKDGHWVVPGEIMTAYYQVMGDAEARQQPPRAADQPATVAEVLDEYLGWLRQQPHKAARTNGP
jgi:hypothetical protein